MLARTATADRHHTALDHLKRARRDQPQLVRRPFVLVAAAMVIATAGCGGDDGTKEGPDAARTPLGNDYRLCWQLSATRACCHDRQPKMATRAPTTGC